MNTYSEGMLKYLDVSNNKIKKLNDINSMIM